MTAGLWQPLPGGYRLLPARDHFDRVRSAVVILPNGVVSHETAAELHRIPMVERGLATVSVHSRTTHEFPGVRIHRCHDLLETHVQSVDGLPVTTLPRTVADLAVTRSEKHIRAIVDDLLVTKRMTATTFVSMVSDIARRGRPGSAMLKRLANEFHDLDPDSSRLEREGRRVLAEGGCPTPEMEYPIPWAPNRRFDDAYPLHDLAIEWDSVRWHLRVDGFQIDRYRDRQAVLHGWRVLRFTWFDVTERPAEVVYTVLQALAA